MQGHAIQSWSWARGVWRSFWAGEMGITGICINSPKGKGSLQKHRSKSCIVPYSSWLIYMGRVRLPDSEKGNITIDCTGLWDAWVPTKHPTTIKKPQTIQKRPKAYCYWRGEPNCYQSAGCSKLTLILHSTHGFTSPGHRYLTVKRSDLNFFLIWHQVVSRMSIFKIEEAELLGWIRESHPL